MRKILFAAFAIAMFSVTAPTFGQAKEITCSRLENVLIADANWKMIGIRRPKIDVQFTKTNVQVNMPIATARKDADGTIIDVDMCRPDQIGYHLWVVHNGDWDEMQIPMPATAKGIEIRSCTASHRCFVGRFDGDFTKWVTLQDDAPPQSATKISGQYHE